MQRTKSPISSNLLDLTCITGVHVLIELACGRLHCKMCKKNLVYIFNITALNVVGLTIDSCRHKKGACHRCLQYHISPLSNEPYLGIKMKAIFLWSLYSLSIVV